MIIKKYLLKVYLEAYGNIDDDDMDEIDYDIILKKDYN